MNYVSGEMIENRIMEERIIAVLVFESENELKPVIDSLLEGGIRIIELALRTDYSLKAIEKAKKEYPEMIIGAGTVIKPEQIDQLKGLEIPFAVAPGFNRMVVEKAASVNLPFFPGVATPSEIEAAVSMGIRILKLFPAEHLGGLKYLNSINAPYLHLNLRYIPLGGVGQNNLKNYLMNPNIGGVGGSWIASRSLIEKRQWKEIRQNAKDAVSIRDEVSKISGKD